MISRIFKGMAVVCVLLASTAALALDQIPEYRDPLAELTIDSEGNNYQFEHSSLRALKIHDPIEGFNRRMYRFNGQFDRYVYLPAVNAYVKVTPKFVRSGVSNVFANLADVPNLANSLAQGKMQKSGRTTARLLLNTTIGVLGIFDVAKAFGLPQEPEDFGQTLGYYGVPEGPYLVLPLLGPSTLRDTTGRAVDWSIEDAAAFLDNRSYMNDNPWSYGLYALNLRYINNFRYGSLDSPFEYDQVRYLYIKLRELQIKR
ncbi:phospholipid-binding lipoprotein MlaA [Halopseudomonas formosensis]|uniref:Phospholipid-binding lipoprotein MlaA n=1 Tax=Halopseudomonas formosensis TaxID=1002526 RepID=A0A1I6AKP7_9GAMM|nr:VacJ family lipoprotein [Halopseudomonas formosensis]SFQ69256.1 phospholipid-binding lipoprotein MlaA [Halopseudomonas formosensis]